MDCLLRHCLLHVRARGQGLLAWLAMAHTLAHALSHSLTHQLAHVFSSSLFPHLTCPVCSCRVGIVLPKIEVRFLHLNITAKVHVGQRALPTLINYSLNFVEVLDQFTCTSEDSRFFPSVLLACRGTARLSSTRSGDLTWPPPAMNCTGNDRNARPRALQQAKTRNIAGYFWHHQAFQVRACVAAGIELFLDRTTATNILILPTNKVPLCLACRMTLLLGPPNAGKTTLLKALAGKNDPDLKVSKQTLSSHASIPEWESPALMYFIDS